MTVVLPLSALAITIVGSVFRRLIAAFSELVIFYSGLAHFDAATILYRKAIFSASSILKSAITGLTYAIIWRTSFLLLPKE